MKLKPNVICVGILQIFQSTVGIRPVFARLRHLAVEIFQVKTLVYVVCSVYVYKWVLLWGVVGNFVWFINLIYVVGCLLFFFYLECCFDLVWF